VHGESQHKPSTQLPDWHCVEDVHTTPFGSSGWQVASELRHQSLGTHCVSFTQVVPHEVPPVAQVYGVQLVGLGWQTPAPLHVGVVRVPFEQLAAAQTVPLK
jgi:hypothetical protein